LYDQKRSSIKGGKMLRFGLCCIFIDEPVRFRIFTAKSLSTRSRPEQLKRISQICLHNAENLLKAVNTVARLGIGAFRITSPLLPRYTHPEVGYILQDLPDVQHIENRLSSAGDFAADRNIRLSFHPDQFVVISSPDPSVVERSRLELEYQAMLAERVGAETINLHGGGAYGDKTTTLRRLRRVFDSFSESVRKRLTLENDDRVYTVRDLTPVCSDLKIPLVYDVHHHRCNPDGLTEEQATELSLRTWEKAGREPYFHISSPKNGWEQGDPKPHADYIDADDFPDCWNNLTATVDVEAKAKELAVLKLMKDLSIRGC
jgi:UV DNA damage endonuclease